jgi:hypothetical protein
MLLKAPTPGRYYEPACPTSGWSEPARAGYARLRPLNHDVGHQYARRQIDGTTREEITC